MKSLKLNRAYYPGGISSVRLLGTDQQLYFDRNVDALTIKLPDNLPEQVTYSFKIFRALIILK